MKRTSLLLVLVLLAGCRDATKTDPTVKKTAQKADKVQLALDIFRQGGDAPPYRESLDLLNESLAKPEIRERFALSADDRAFLEGPGKLSKQAVDELAALVFVPSDAVHVESSALFRDAARPLQLAGMSPDEQAAFAFDWLCRHVLLYEERAPGLSPASILRAGFGGPSDRGACYLALAHQLGLEGCLIVRPGETEAPLVGVLADKKLILFDTRLGMPVAGPGGKGIATFEDIQQSPALLAVSKILPDDVKKLEARIAVPMESLAPRMKYLDSLLQGELEHVGGERLSAYHDAAGIAKQLSAAGVANVGLWPPTLRPTTVLKDDELIPWPQVVQKYQELKLWGDLHKAAMLKLVGEVTGTLMEKYYRQPGEMLLRNRTKQLVPRLDRIRTALDEGDLGGRDDLEQLMSVAGKWRQRVNEAYLSGEVRKEAEGAAQINAIWVEDHYLLALLQPDSETKILRPAKKDLSRLVLAATREPLAARSNWIFALMFQDKAERLGELMILQKEKGNDNKGAALEVDSAWKNARSAWAKYLDFNNFGPSHFLASLPELRRHAERGDVLRLLAQWEHLERELHLYVAAKLELARATAQTGQNASVILDDLSKELSELLADESLAKTRAAIGATLGNTPEIERRWSRLMRDWGENGNLAWVLESVKLARK